MNWDIRFIVTVEEGYKRAKDVRIQTALACDFTESWIHSNIVDHVEDIIDDYVELSE